MSCAGLLWVRFPCEGSGFEVFDPCCCFCSSGFSSSSLVIIAALDCQCDAIPPRNATTAHKREALEHNAEAIAAVIAVHYPVRSLLIDPNCPVIGPGWGRNRCM